MPVLSAGFASKYPGVKLGTWSPSNVPFRKTRVPNIALATFKLATAGTGPSSANVRRYQNASRRGSFCGMLWRLATFGPGASKGGVANDTRPGTGTVRSKFAGGLIHLPLGDLPRAVE